MAKKKKVAAKNGVNRSKMIREAIEKNSALDDEAIANQLKRFGVSKEYVYQIRHKAKTTKGMKSTKGKKGDFAIVKLAIQFSDDCGGIKNAITVLQNLSKMG